jgi:hypothetical protein
MGDWGAQPWSNDEAADWFHRFWKKSDFSVLIDEIRNFDQTQERYDSFRAASYVLQTMGNPYIWPSEHRAVLKELLERSVDVLEKMIHPPDETWGFLDMWGNDPQVVDSVRHQIAELKVRRSELIP